MGVQIQSAPSDQKIELTVFDIGNINCAVDISHVQEINRHIEITKVYRAPTYVRGVMSLRGQIVTIIDMRNKFGLPSMDINEEMRIIIVKSHDQSIGLLIDRVDDVIVAETQEIAAPPPNVSGVCGSYFTGVYRTETSLVAILNIDEILKFEK